LILSVALSTKLTSEVKSPGVLVKGWFKYIILDPSSDKQDFETNPDFENESRTLTKAESEMTDEVGKVDIPDNKSFYMVLTTSTLNILTSRRNQITKTIDVLDLRNVNPITSSVSQSGDLIYRGGMEVLGKFDEGKCVKLNFRSGKA